jgi:hypothetical protein
MRIPIQFHVSAVPDLAFHSNADPDPASQNNAKPSASGILSCLPCPLVFNTVLSVSENWCLPSDTRDILRAAAGVDSSSFLQSMAGGTGYINFFRCN